MDWIELAPGSPERIKKENKAREHLHTITRLQDGDVDRSSTAGTSTCSLVGGSILRRNSAVLLQHKGKGNETSSSSSSCTFPFGLSSTKGDVVKLLSPSGYLIDTATLPANSPLGYSFARKDLKSKSQAFETAIPTPEEIPNVQAVGEKDASARVIAAFRLSGKTASASSTSSTANSPMTQCCGVAATWRRNRNGPVHMPVVVVETLPAVERNNFGGTPVRVCSCSCPSSNDDDGSSCAPFPSETSPLLKGASLVPSAWRDVDTTTIVYDNMQRMPLSTSFPSVRDLDLQFVRSTSDSFMNEKNDEEYGRIQQPSVSAFDRRRSASLPKRQGQGTNFSFDAIEEYLGHCWLIAG